MIRSFPDDRCSSSEKISCYFHIASLQCKAEAVVKESGGGRNDFGSDDGFRRHKRAPTTGRFKATIVFRWRSKKAGVFSDKGKIIGVRKRDIIIAKTVAKYGPSTLLIPG